jgi:hypothetical protein
MKPSPSLLITDLINMQSVSYIQQQVEYYILFP